MKRCPFCAEQIQDDAVKCRFCGEWLAADAPKPEPAPYFAPPATPPVREGRMGLLARRVAAYMVDVGIVVIGMQLCVFFDPLAFSWSTLGGPIPVGEGESVQMLRMISPIGMLIFWPLFLCRDVLRVGKLAFGLRVIRTDTRRPAHLGLSIVRNLAFFVPFGALVEYIAARVSPKGQRLMDRWLRTQTVPTSGVFPAGTPDRAAPFSPWDIFNPAMPLVACCVAYAGIFAAVFASAVNERPDRGDDTEYWPEPEAKAEIPSVDPIYLLRRLADAQYAYHTDHGFYSPSLGGLTDEGYFVDDTVAADLRQFSAYGDFYFHDLTPNVAMPVRFAYALIPKSYTGTAYLIDSSIQIYTADASTASWDRYGETQESPPDPWRLY